MKLLTIGELAQRSRLSPKALRLYDSLGLLRPARVDEWSGYRYYTPDQLERRGWSPGCAVSDGRGSGTRTPPMPGLGCLFQITHDHTVTQAMIDAGQLTPEEAASHPQRSLLLRAFGTAPDGVESASGADTPEFSLHDALPGDRYLLSSDGLTSVVPIAAIRQTLGRLELSPEEIVSRLIALAHEAGGPDNSALAVADISAAAG